MPLFGAPPSPRCTNLVDSSHFFGFFQIHHLASYACRVRTPVVHIFSSFGHAPSCTFPQPLYGRGKGTPYAVLPQFEFHKSHHLLRPDIQHLRFSFAKPGNLSGIVRGPDLLHRKDSGQFHCCDPTTLPLLALLVDAADSICEDCATPATCSILRA